MVNPSQPQLKWAVEVIQNTRCFFTMVDFAGVSGNRLKHKLRDVESELHVASEALGCR